MGRPVLHNDDRDTTLNVIDYWDDNMGAESLKADTKASRG